MKLSKFVVTVGVLAGVAATVYYIAKQSAKKDSNEPYEVNEDDLDYEVNQVYKFEGCGELNKTDTKTPNVTFDAESSNYKNVNSTTNKTSYKEGSKHEL